MGGVGAWSGLFCTSETGHLQFNHLSTDILTQLYCRWINQADLGRFRLCLSVLSFDGPCGLDNCISIRRSRGSRRLIILIDLQFQHPTAWMTVCQLEHLGPSRPLLLDLALEHHCRCVSTSLTNDGIPVARTDHIHAGLRSEHPEYLFDSRLFCVRSHRSETESEL
jgi:hypothetical protein